jgi:hypothetical protein
MSRTRRSRTLAVLAGLLLGGLVPTGATTAPAGAAGAFCGYQGEPGVDVFRWDGGGDGVSWEDGLNWEGDAEPDNTFAASGYVCLDADGPVRLGAGVEARLQAIDVAAGTTLRIVDGGKLFVYGDQTDRVSTFRRGSVVLLERSTLGGPGQVDVEGRMIWRSLPSGAATITTNPCDVGVPGCITAATGRLTISDTGRLQVDGRGVNLFTRYRIIVRGRMTLAGESYVAADRGTALELRARTALPGVGVLDLRNDGGVYEGITRDDPTLADVINGGLILKSGGAGTSAITGDYRVVGNGRVQVDRGTLALPTGSVEAAQVDGGASYGTGQCPNLGMQCTPTTDPDDPSLYRALVPTADGDGALVSVEEGVGSPGGRLDRPVRIVARGLSRGSVLRLTLRYDDSVVGSRTKWTIRIYRIPAGSSTELAVPSCRSNGAFPSAGSVACVWRQRSSDFGGDLVMTVRNRSKFLSRWVGR